MCETSSSVIMTIDNDTLLFSELGTVDSANCMLLTFYSVAKLDIPDTI